MKPRGVCVCVRPPPSLATFATNDHEHERTHHKMAVEILKAVYQPPKKKHQKKFVLVLWQHVRVYGTWCVSRVGNRNSSAPGAADISSYEHVKTFMNKSAQIQTENL